MKVVQTLINGLSVVETTFCADNRGSFERLFCARELADVFGARRIVQINRSLTLMKGSVRGLHFQHSPYAEMKLVRCIRGKVWDVAVDLRRGSKTFLQWHAEELSPENQRMMVIPEGVAHGFQTLEPESELLYLHTAPYAPESEGGFRVDDPLLGITWPLPVEGLSDRDSRHQAIPAGFRGIQF